VYNTDASRGAVRRERKKKRTGHHNWDLAERKERGTSGLDFLKNALKKTEQITKLTSFWPNSRPGEKGCKLL